MSGNCWANSGSRKWIAGGSVLPAKTRIQLAPDKLDSGFRRIDVAVLSSALSKTQDGRKQRGNLGSLFAPLLHRDEEVEDRFLSSLISPLHPNDVIARLLKHMLRSCVTFFVFLFRTPI